MDLEKFLNQVDSQVSGLKTELFEVRQLLKYAFKEDIFDDKKAPSPILNPPAFPYRK